VRGRFVLMTWLAIPVLSQQTPTTLLTLVAVPAIAWILYRTPFRIRCT
jgi:simple sugar transport system permease protein